MSTKDDDDIKTIKNVKYEVSGTGCAREVSTSHDVTFGWLRKLNDNKLTLSDIERVNNPYYVKDKFYPVSLGFKPLAWKTHSTFNSMNPAMDYLLNTSTWYKHYKNYSLLKTGDESTIWHHLDAYVKERSFDNRLKRWCQAFAESVYSDVGIKVPYDLDLDPNRINSIRLTRKSHPGYKWRHVLRYRRKEQVANAAFKEAVNDLQAMMYYPRHSDRPYALLGRKKPFIRDGGPQDFKRMKSRMIMCVDTVDTILGAVVSQDYSKMMKDLNWDTDWRANSNDYYMAYKKWDTWLKDKFILDMDMSDFDSSVHPVILAIAVAVIETSYKSSLFRRNYFNYAYDNICRKRIATPDNLIYELIGGIPSGHPWTTLLGTLCNIIMQRGVLKHFRLANKAKIACCGDDTLVNFDVLLNNSKIKNITPLYMYKKINNYCRKFEQMTGCDIKEYDINEFVSKDEEHGAVFNRNIYLPSGLPTRKISDIARILACPEGGNSGAMLSIVANNYRMLPIFGLHANAFIEHFIHTLGWYRDYNPNLGSTRNCKPGIYRTNKHYKYQWSQTNEDYEKNMDLRLQLTFGMETELFADDENNSGLGLFIIIMRAMEGRSSKYANIYDLTGEVASFNTSRKKNYINSLGDYFSGFKLRSTHSTIKNVYKYVQDTSDYYLNYNRDIVYPYNNMRYLHYGKYSALRIDGTVENYCFW